jgi:O-antigen/teichoic acid export membrane protein
MIAMRWATRALGVVSTVVIARLLTPEDFGVVAMAMVVIGFLEVFTQTGVDLALIRDREPTRDHYDSAWTMEVLLATGLALVLFFAAPLAATYFDDARVLDVMRVLALRAFIGGFENIGVVAFRRELAFAREFWFGVIKKVATVAVTIGIAITLRSYWALVIGLVGGRLLDVAISFRMHPYRPRFRVNKLGEIWNFSRWLLLSRIANMLNRKLDEFVVGGQAGTVSMGHYTVASDIATSPTEEIVLPMSRGIFPVYSRQLDDRAKLAESFLTVLATTAYLCAAFGLGVSSVAPDLVPVILGEQWLAAVPLMQLLGIWGVVMGMALTLDPLLLASGRAWLLARFKWLQLIVLAPSLVIGGKMAGVVGIAAAKTIVMAVMLPLFLFWAARAEGISARRVLGAISTPLLAGAAMYAAVIGAADLLAAQPAWLRLASEIITGATVYLATSALTWWLRGRPPGPESAVLARTFTLFRRTA